MSNIFKTNWGIIELPSNEAFISLPFKQGSYWDIDTLLKLESYIPKDRNILEIGGHVGTSTIVYASFLNKDSKYWVFEPQSKIFSYLQKNIKHNNLEQIVKAIHGSAFCYTGKMNMNSTPVDGPNTKIPINFLESNVKKLVRPNEINFVRCSPKKIKKIIGWKSTKNINQIIDKLLNNEIF